MTIIGRGLCWLGYHRTRSVGYSVNDGPKKNQMFELMQCYDCNQCWKEEFGFLQRKLYEAMMQKPK